MQTGPGLQLVDGVNEDRREYYASLDLSNSAAMPELSAETIKANRVELKNDLTGLEFSALSPNAYELISSLSNITISAKPEFNRNELNGFYQDMADSFADSVVELAGQSPEISVKAALPAPEAVFTATAQYSNAPDYVWMPAARNAINSSLAGIPNPTVENRMEQLRLNMIFTSTADNSEPSTVNLKPSTVNLKPSTVNLKPDPREDVSLANAA
jgi:hypothetical protein